MPLAKIITVIGPQAAGDTGKCSLHLQNHLLSQKMEVSSLAMYFNYHEIKGQHILGTDDSIWEVLYTWEVKD